MARNDRRLRAGARQIDRRRGPLPDAEIEQVGDADPADPLEPAGQRAKRRGEAERGQRKLDHDRRRGSGDGEQAVTRAMSDRVRHDQRHVRPRDQDQDRRRQGRSRDRDRGALAWPSVRAAMRCKAAPRRTACGAGRWPAEGIVAPSVRGARNSGACAAAIAAVIRISAHRVGANHAATIVIERYWSNPPVTVHRDNRANGWSRRTAKESPH